MPDDLQREEELFFKALKEPDCPLHGTDSVWYNIPEQVKKKR